MKTSVLVNTVYEPKLKQIKFNDDQTKSSGLGNFFDSMLMLTNESGFAS